MKKLTIVVFTVVLSLLINSSAQAQRIGSADVNLRVQKSSIKYNFINAFYDGRGVYLKWQTEYERKNFGFYIYRISGGGRELIDSSFVAGSALQVGGERSAGKNYVFYDADGDFNSKYVIESLDTNSNRKDSDLITPEYVNDLSEVTSSSSDFYAKVKTESKTRFERNSLNMPKDLRLEYDGNQSLTDTETHRAVVAQSGVKIGVKKEGFYRVSRAELQTAGFDVNVNSASWQLFLNGVEQSIIIGGSGGDYIEFYGKGIDTAESDTAFYYLIAGSGNGKRINPITLRSIGGRVLAKSYNQAFVFKERTNYFSTILNGETENWFGRVISNSGATVTFNLNAVDFELAETAMKISLQGATLVAHQVKVQLNNQELEQITGNSYNVLSKEYKIPTQFLREGTNTLKLTAASGLSVFESVRLSFNRRYTAQQNQLSFYTQNYKTANLDGFSSANIRVFDLTNPQSPSIITNLNVQSNAGNYGVTLPSHRGRVMFAVEDSAILSAASVTANSASNLSTPTHNANLVIISHKNFLTQAESWANYRRAQGVTVEVVDVEDVYDEYSFGVLSSLAIRNFLQYAKNNWQTPPKYVLLIGDSSFDSRNYYGIGNFNLVPTKLVDTIYSETGSDDSLADFNNDGLAEIAVGRIPARNGQTVTDALAKVTSFEATVSQAATRGALFASDLPEGYDFAAVSQRLANQLPATIPKVFVNRGTANSQTILVNEINTGKFLVNYSGHGNLAVWAHTNFFGKNNVPQLTNATNLSVFTMLSCLNGYFIDPQEDSLSELLLKTNNGGAAAAWSSSGLTTPDVQEIMALRFYNQISAGNITRLGDLINDSKTVLTGGRDVRLSWTLLGDPMLKMK
ncbi:MAG: C25 family cysteine peptidase [Acidobacteriota bacterium]|nr:C25 family cysteine peptidase [Acidobacteriota bacterium]